MNDTPEHKENEKESVQNENIQQEPIVSPKNNDELIIEIDEKQNIEHTELNTSPSESISNYANEELEPEKEQIQEPQKKETKAERIARLKQAKHKKKEEPQQEKLSRENNSKSKIGLILIVSLFIIVSAGAYLFVINPSILAKQFPSLVEKGIISIESETKHTNETIAKTDSTDNTIITKEEIDTQNSSSVPEEEVVKTITKTLESQTPVKKNTQQTDSQPIDRVVTKGKLQTPCWIISYSSISNEATAIKTVATLSTQGKKCGYYWIPDYVSNGPKLFKVYIGPYNTKDAALTDLPQIKGEVSGAYVTEVK
ncbi:MAG TPA: SPOR domain-containing protein [Bacteroidales bacterium]|nr:SPOR domain-containing protein [Bacteroidales bacterium]HRS18986.1 SPOR domain-containing protein [Bacteroidales bacterium]